MTTVGTGTHFPCELLGNLQDCAKLGNDRKRLSVGSAAWSAGRRGSARVAAGAGQCVNRGVRDVIFVLQLQI